MLYTYLRRCPTDDIPFVDENIWKILENVDGTAALRPNLLNKVDEGKILYTLQLIYVRNGVKYLLFVL